MPIKKLKNTVPTSKSENNIGKHKPHKNHNIAPIKKHYISNIIDKDAKNIPLKHYANNIYKIEKKTLQTTKGANHTNKKTDREFAKNSANPNTDSIFKNNQDTTKNIKRDGMNSMQKKTSEDKTVTQTTKPINISQSHYKNLYNWIASHKYYPTEALYKNEQGNVLLNFIISSNGTISLVKISKYSEYDSLNRAAVKIIKRSSPIPKDVLHISKIKLPMTGLLKMTFKIQ